MASKYRNAGQTCVCANRIYVQEGVYDAFAAKLAERDEDAQGGQGHGGGREPSGPLIDAQGLAKVEEHVADARRQGREGGGGRQALRARRALLRADAAHRRHARDEGVARGDLRPRGAALPLQGRAGGAAPSPTRREFGLAAYFYSRDVGRVFRVAEAIESGMVGVNTGIISNEVAPFGGVKQSGLGREGSKYGVEDFLEIKYVCLGGIQ